MTWLGHIGILTLILGLFYLFMPGFLKILDAWGKEVLVTVEQTLKYHIWIGIFFTAAAIAMIYIGYIFVK